MKVKIGYAELDVVTEDQTDEILYIDRAISEKGNITLRLPPFDDKMEKAVAIIPFDYYKDKVIYIEIGKDEGSTP